MRVHAWSLVGACRLPTHTHAARPPCSQGGDVLNGRFKSVSEALRHMDFAYVRGLRCSHISTAPLFNCSWPTGKSARGVCKRLWAWTAAAGRTSCVLKGRQNALFGWWRVGKV